MKSLQNIVPLCVYQPSAIRVSSRALRAPASTFRPQIRRLYHPRQPILLPTSPPRPRRSTKSYNPSTRFLSTTSPALARNSSQLRPASESAAAPSFGTAHKPWRPAPHRDPNEPVYELYFTCNACNHRAGHTISKQGYHKGTTLVKCPGCGVRHLISDHLKIFSDESTTIEDIMRERGEDVSRGVINEQGDVELWDEESIRWREDEARQAEEG